MKRGMSIGQIILATVVTVGFIFLTYLYFTMKSHPGTLPPLLKENIGLMTGCWITNFTTLINWSFGSSKGSDDKTKALLTAMLIEKQGEVK
ncbi:MAG: hypothetical protein DRP09_20780 [Candidatus Thorarchaeota archaeon]|nr:MAG: hypothetical protein DRP09_20780 [Candidatus Thorarchaeota archaeon]